MDLPQISTQTLLLGSLLLSVLVVAALVYIARLRSSSSGNLILLVGNEDAGKTAILSTMVYDYTPATHTSFQVNNSLVQLSPKGPLQVVDVPGHQRLRGPFRTHVPDAKAIVFVVDSSTISRNGRDVAEHLHHVLHAIISLPPTRTLPALLILAHKTDLLSSASVQDRPALAVARVRTVLERELEKRRAAAAGGVGVEGLGAEGEGTEMGGLECGAGGAFRFAEWEGGEVSFAGTWVKVGAEVNEKANGEKAEGAASGLDVLKVWLDGLA
ncbi:hypothetical protein M0805_002750 [Coniferiporia weirii]|nr:hypothetical protein M0805_002750 [Coniferiporia weirii]